jgi:hypothetical protein
MHYVYQRYNNMMLGNVLMDMCGFWLFIINKKGKYSVQTILQMYIWE